MNRATRHALSAAVLLALAGIAVLACLRLGERGQWEAARWRPFTRPATWTNLIVPGLLDTLEAASIATVLALGFAVVFAAARLSDHRVVRIPAGAVVEFFRGTPVLILIFFAQFGAGSLLGLTVPALAAVVFGLTLYNGSVIAEILRAGVRALPSGQAEAAQSIGLRKTQAMRYVLFPQAVTAMLPSIVGQLAVLLKDTSLGFIIAYEELLNAGVRTIPANYDNEIPAVIVVAALYILMNLAIGHTATRLERRTAAR